MSPLLLTHREEDALAGLTTVTLTEEGCPCLEPRFLRGGVLRMRVSAVERTAYAPVRYTLRTAWDDHPRSFASGAGSVQCPAQCAFTREP